MNRYFAATLLLSLTLAVGCQPQADDGEDVPESPTVVTPEPTPPTATAEEPANLEPPAPAESDASAGPPSGGSESETASERTPDVSTTAEAGAEVPEEDAPPTETDFMQQLNTAMRSGDTKAALEVAEQAQAAFPESPQWMSFRAGILGRDGRAEEGWDLLKAAYQEAPEDGQLATQVLGFAVTFGDRAEGEVKHKLILGAVAVLDEIEEAGRLEALGRSRGVIVERIRVSEAQVRAMQGDFEAATRALKLAFAEGFRDTEMLHEDEAFAELLKIEDVAQMVAAREEEIRLEYLAEASTAIEAGESFPFHFSLKDTAGETVAMEDYAGKLLIVDFWGTWCPPCRKEIPHFIKLLETYGDDLAIVGINYERGADDEENIKLIDSFAETMGIEYPCLPGDDETKNQVPDLRGFPTTLFLDRTGKVRLTTVGYRPYGNLDAIISVLLEETPAEAASEKADEEPAADSTEESAEATEN